MGKPSFLAIISATEYGYIRDDGVYVIPILLFQEGDQEVKSFVCIHNSARSQMAEAFLNRLGQGKFTAESAGLEPGSLNPFVVKSMAEIGYDISSNQTDSVFEFFKKDRKYNVVVKVCDQANGPKCPIFPSAKTTLVWSFADPSSFVGTATERMVKTNEVRDQIKTRIEEFIRVCEVEP